MYLYFDVNGNLKEIINDPIRQGDDNANTIFVYLEPSTNKVVTINSSNYQYFDWETIPTESSVQVFMLPLPTVYDAWMAAFKITDSNTVLTPDGIGESMSDSDYIKQIPYDKERDLKYFKYFKYYQFIKIDLTSAITQHNGRCDCTISMIKSEQVIKNLDTFSFFIQSSVVLKNITITTAQYQYLYSKISNVADTTWVAENYVPYTGATSDLNLSASHELKFGQYYGIMINNNNLMLYSGTGNIVIAPENFAYLDSVSDNNKIATHVDLPKKRVCGSFNTSGFEKNGDDDFYSLTGGASLNLNGGYITGSDLLIITWGNSFAICPVPTGTERGAEIVMYDVSSSNVTVSSDATYTYFDVELESDDNEESFASVPQIYSVAADISVNSEAQTLENVSGTVTSSTISNDNLVLNVRFKVLNSSLNEAVETVDELIPYVYRTANATGHVVAALVSNQGYTQTVRVAYQLSLDNASLNIALDSSFTPPANYTGYVTCIKL